MQLVTLLYNFKEALSSIKKVNGISEVKTIMFNRMKNGGIAIKSQQYYYRNDDPAKNYDTVLKKEI